MNIILSRTLLILLSILCCTCKALDRRQNVLSRFNEKTTKISHKMEGLFPMPATTAKTTATSKISTYSQSNQTEIAILVVRKSLRFSPSDICGGILVSSRIVITAAHCFYDPHGFYRKYPDMFRVVSGRSGVYQNVAMEGPSAKLVVAHPNYNENERVDDIGAIRLKESIQDGSTMIAEQSVPLAQKWNDGAQLEMLMFSIENETLQVVTTDRMAARLTSKYRCEQSYHRWGIHIGPRQLCIEQVNPEFYHRGESAILLLNGQPIGVLSFKLDVTSRANSLPYIYTELSRYPEFIRKEIHTDAAERLKPYRICSSILYVVISMGVVK